MSIPRLKRTREASIQLLKAPPYVKLPVGTLVPVVATGDRVEVGELVLTSKDDADLQFRRHASLSGTVTATDADIIIHGEPGEVRTLHYESENIVEAAREAGMMGMGGGSFPTYVKLTAADRNIDTVIVNGCESEPYVACDYRVLIEERDEVENGLRLAREALGAKFGIIVDTDVTYPGGDERLLVERIVGREVPPFKRPMDVGVVVFNVQTVGALHRAVALRRPVVDRVITVDGGAVGRPGNYRVSIGTEVGHILAACDTDHSRIAALLCGGPMMGDPAQLDTPIVAGTIAVLALTEDEVSRPTDDPCIRCGQCLEACPYGLPAGLLVRSPSPAVLQCVECGACEFVCPSRRALVARLHDLKRHYSTISGIPVG